MSHQQRIMAGYYLGYVRFNTPCSYLDRGTPHPFGLILHKGCHGLTFVSLHGLKISFPWDQRKPGLGLCQAIES